MDAAQPLAATKGKGKKAKVKATADKAIIGRDDRTKVGYVRMNHRMNADGRGSCEITKGAKCREEGKKAEQPQMNADGRGFSNFDIGHSLFGIRYSRLVYLEIGKLLPLLAKIAPYTSN